jgi:hypothetical protein
MRFRDLSNWPPRWVRVGTGQGKAPKALTGEIGILKEVRCYRARRGRLYLKIHYGGAVYVGCLVIDDEHFCERMAEHLRRHYGMSVDAIGSSEITLRHGRTTADSIHISRPVV